MAKIAKFAIFRLILEVKMRFSHFIWVIPTLAPSLSPDLLFIPARVQVNWKKG